MKREDLKRFISAPEVHASKDAASDEVRDFHKYGMMHKLFGGSYKFADEKIWPGGPFQRFEGNIRILKAVPSQYVVPHIEDHDQVQIFLGEIDSPDSLTAEITLEDQKFEAKSPFMAIYPMGLKHAERIISGAGWFLTIHLARQCISYGKPLEQCPVKLGEEYDVTVEETSRQGQGIARVRSFAIFVPNTKTGDRVRVKIKRTSLLAAEAEIVP